jgi:hypothetical protein
VTSLARDHIFVILIAFLAALGCFTTVTLIGVDPTGVSTLRDVLLALGGTLGGVAVGSKLATRPDDDAPSS